MVLTVAAAFGALSTAAALGATAHKYVGQFGASGAGPGDLSFPQGIATDQSTGDIYVADSGNNRVQIYSHEGDPIGQLSGTATTSGSFAFFSPLRVAVDGTAGRAYVADAGNNVVDMFDTTGAFSGQLDPSATPATAFSGPQAVAVDPSTGDVYVADTNNNVVDVFSSTGTFVTSFDGSSAPEGAFSSPRGIAVDTSSNVYVSDMPDGFGVPTRLREFTALGAGYTATSPVTSAAGVAIDPTNDDLYIVETAPAAQVARYDSSGAFQEVFGSGRLMSPVGVALSPSNHRAYVADGDGSVKIFSTFTAADVTTGGASAITDTQATLDGTINPQGGGDTYTYFEFGSGPGQYQGQTGWQGPFNGTSDIAVSDTAMFLQPNTTYHYRLTAYTPAGLFSGADATFTTAAVPPTLDGQPAYATSLTTSSASLHGFVNPNNSPTTYHFEYGTTTGYGSTTPDASAGSGFGDTDVSSDIAGLQAGTTYHFRVVADNGTGGAQNGADATFTTPPAGAPTADEVTAVSATLTGSLSAGGSSRTYHFTYGKVTPGDQSTDNAPAGAAAGQVSATITDLEPGTTYQFQLVSNDGPTTSTSPVGTFTTDPAPVVTTGAATDVTSSSAMLHGTADTNGLEGTYRFAVVGVNSTVSRLTPEQPVTSDGPTAVSAAISDLPDQGTYEVRLIVSASGAEVRGDATEFRTSKAEVIVPRENPPATNPYGCSAPQLAAPTGPVTPGLAYTLAGSDLGVGGTVTLGGSRAAVSGWSASGVTIQIPDDARGSLDVTVDCGKASNTVTLKVAAPPSNAFTIVSARVSGHSSRGVVTVRVPGPGAVRIGGTYVGTATRTLAKAGSYRIGVKLNGKGRKRLGKARSGRLSAGLAVRYTPKGGTAATKTAHLAFKRH